MSTKRMRGKPRGFDRLQARFTQLIRENGHLTERQTSELADYVCVSLAKFTEPYGMGTKAKQAGEDAVAGDVRKTISAISPSMERYLRLRGVSDRSRNVHLNWRRGKELKEIVIKELDLYATDQKLQKTHSAHRVHGKVKTSLSRADTLTTSIARRDRFIKQQQKFVGLGKAGWIAAMGNGGKYNPPRWLRAQATAGAGKRYKNGQPGKQYAVHVHNNVSYVDYLLRPSKIDSALSEGYGRVFKKWQKALDFLSTRFSK